MANELYKVTSLGNDRWDLNEDLSHTTVQVLTTVH